MAAPVIGILSIVLGGVGGGIMVMLFAPRTISGDARAFAWTFILIGVLIIGFIVAAVYAAYVSAYIKRYYYDASDQFLTIQKGVFAPTEIHVQYVKVQDVYVDQDVLDRVMGLYDVHVASATTTSSIEAHIDGVDAQTAERLKNFLLNKIQDGHWLPRQEVPASREQPAVSVSFQPSSDVFQSKKYPIQGTWIFISLMRNLFTAGIYVLFVWFFLYRRFAGLYIMHVTQFLIIYVTIWAIQSVWVLFWKETFSFAFLPQFLLVKDGVVRREEKHVPYRVLQNVLLKQDILERIWGLSTVVIENAAAGSSKTGRASRIILPGQPVDKGNELVQELNRILGQSIGQERAL